VRLDAGARRALEHLLTRPLTAAWAFRLRIAAQGRRYRLVEAGANLRSRAGLPYGDQGLVVARRQYDAVGGHPATPLFEDVALVRALGGVTRIRILPAAVTVSARRWRRDGVLRRSLGNASLLVRYLAGAAPDRLAAAYPPEASPDG
jgi:hypothetical protein